MGGGDIGEHVLRETTSRGLCGLVNEGRGEEGERERERAGEVRLHYIQPWIFTKLERARERDMCV